MVVKVVIKLLRRQFILPWVVLKALKLPRMNVAGLCYFGHSCALSLTHTPLETKFECIKAELDILNNSALKTAWSKIMSWHK